MGLGLPGRVAGTRPLNHRLACRPADPREWVGCIHLKFSVSCDVLTAEIPPGGQIPPHLPRARELPMTCANPLGRPGLRHLSPEGTLLCPSHPGQVPGTSEHPKAQRNH